MEADLLEVVDSTEGLLSQDGRTAMQADQQKIVPQPHKASAAREIFSPVSRHLEGKEVTLCLTAWLDSSTALEMHCRWGDVCKQAQLNGFSKRLERSWLS